METKVNAPGHPVTKEDKKAFAPLTETEKKAAIDRATLPEREALAAKEKMMAEALDGIDPSQLSDHVRNELGIENRPVTVAEEVKEVNKEMADTKKELTGDTSKSPSKDDLKNPAEKALDNPSKGPEKKEGPMPGVNDKKK